LQWGLQQPNTLAVSARQVMRRLLLSFLKFDPVKGKIHRALFNTASHRHQAFPSTLRIGQPPAAGIYLLRSRLALAKELCLALHLVESRLKRITHCIGPSHPRRILVIAGLHKDLLKVIQRLLAYISFA
jgi:hypothetical protein